MHVYVCVCVYMCVSLSVSLSFSTALCHHGHAKVALQKQLPVEGTVEDVEQISGVACQRPTVYNRYHES